MLTGGGADGGSGSGAPGADGGSSAANPPSTRTCFNAVVAFDDSAWIDDTQRPLYWQGIMQARTDFDLVWTTGIGNAPPFVNAGETASTYNGKTGTYSWLHSTTGKKIVVDESAGASQQADTWSNQSAATLDALIADGVVAVNVSGAPSTYQSNVTVLQSHLGSTCP
jgi:hypothetical protein